MQNASLTVSHDALKAALQYVPADMRGQFALALLGLQEEEHPEQGEYGTTVISIEEARQLKSKLDSATNLLIEEMLRNEKDGVAIAEWKRVKEITGVDTWGQFAKGRLGGIHRSLNKIRNVAGGSRLINEGDGWVEDGQGDYSAGIINIDGPTVKVLKAAYGFAS